ncbi:hypothetical protein BHM03_00017099 [Ensete ventricosum]|uniref:FAS1 domain-containing protein n=1 Tax=Ensete ventricosum TaxID=4639 RepID=A0A445MF19_ENSVE|nr:hypothetical protein BHM03_00017099 [Ensete ventricosum]
MATHLLHITLLSLLAAASSHHSIAASSPPHGRDIVVAVREMQRASYFSFAMLIQMVQDKVPDNSTFLMPSDRMLSKILIPENEVVAFLGRHSIPSLLLFDDLRRLPSGTLVPTYQPDSMITVNNSGRRNLYLNGALLICAGPATLPPAAAVPLLAPPPQPTWVAPPSVDAAVGPSPAGFDDSARRSGSPAIRFSMACSAAIVQFLILSAVNNPS